MSGIRRFESKAGKRRGFSCDVNIKELEVEGSFTWKCIYLNFGTTSNLCEIISISFILLGIFSWYFHGDICIICKNQLLNANMSI